MIDHNVSLLNCNHLESSFFFLDRNDPTVGFTFDASSIFGYGFPPTSVHGITPVPISNSQPTVDEAQRDLHLRLVLGSHLAQYLRLRLEEEKGYTSTVGISTTKLISKLVGNVNKPKGQTTLLPPYDRPAYEGVNNVVKFLDEHDIGKVPGIGFKMSQKIRQHVLGREATFNAGLVYGATKEHVTVKDVRLFSGMGSELLEKILDGPGVPKGIGNRIWSLINGVDEAEVAKAREVPQQISIEDSYIRLDTMEDIHKELKILSKSLLKRMRVDLISTSTPDIDDDPPTDTEFEKGNHVLCTARPHWIAYPRSLRLTTRPRPPMRSDGTRGRFFNRISRSGPMPAIVFNLYQSVESLSEKLVSDSLIPLFHKLHPEKSGWDLSLVNLCATNMVLVANDSKQGAGRDIKRMFDRQDEVLKHWKVEDIRVPPISPEDHMADEHNADGPGLPKAKERPDHRESATGSEDLKHFSQDSQMEDVHWTDDEDVTAEGETCKVCGAIMPSFAVMAHMRFHDMPD